MSKSLTFERRGIVEGFFGPLWSVNHRAAIFEFGARRGMNTYLYAPKDDPYHRLHWKKPYPNAEWQELTSLIRKAQQSGIDFVYSFHPGKGLAFSAEKPLDALLSKARSFYGAGVRTFAILFDDIPSRLEHEEDQKRFHGSLARAEAFWLGRVLEREPGDWTDVEWWICPSRYSEDPLLEKMFGSFEPRFWEIFGAELPETVVCLWTGPRVVPKEITLADAAKAKKRLRHRLILWDNYPVNDLSMSHEMHIGPLTGRDPCLPREVYGYLNNPLLQEALSLIPLATCFDYARDPLNYNPEKSWTQAILELFPKSALGHWQTLREFFDHFHQAPDKPHPLSPTPRSRLALKQAREYLLQNRKERWSRELQPWLATLEKALRDDEGR